MVKLAAVAGVDPYSEDLTPQDIYWMSQAVLEERWDHTASLMLMQYNAAGPKKQLTVADFHPFRKKRAEHKGKKGELTGASLRSFRKYCKNWKDK